MELTVTDLAVARGGVPVLEGVSFTLSGGEALVLRGPNGIGKTTLLRTVAGLQPPLAGHVGLDREAMAYAGHADGIKATLSVRENLTFWADVFATDRVGEALAAFELEPLADRFAGNLSAGQKRRLGLARMVVTGRPVWVLDEPTVSLDVDAVAMFARAVRAHLGGGGMALLATHIDLGLDEARVLNLAPFRARAPEPDDFDGAFL
ncbi:heme ABC exporter ATP-binding protein CcmA [Lutimaribacter saemankumensis]|uniref:Heme exporter protein A n=1 Tax=Lutimaribacter saemankumensis TaxID=490829 RepID=A0A1G8HRS7_9RHOB|nr:heme ABC exporter ATP-binding protein CcmA [Lutimaribacter saemankumensis]SDI09200.1 heme exporter protein A [Lutimaribacter saemankumensis]